MIERLQHITQSGIADFDHLQQIEAVGKAGVKWTQLRMKDVSTEEFLTVAIQARVLTHQLGMKLIINDNTEVAKACNADGVHLGQNDLSTQEARNLLGANIIIGRTCNTREHIEALHDDHVDYIGLGPFRHTTTKKTLSPLLGLKGYKELVPIARNIPIIAIGGLNYLDVKDLRSVGVHGVAVASEINQSNTLEDSCSHFLNSLI